MKRAVIFYNGDLTQVKIIKQHTKPDDFFICADGGALNAEKAGIVPDVIIGDFDSLPQSKQEKYKEQNVAFVRYNKEKDETDSELALQFALNNGFKTLLIFGLFGTRIDHMLTNLFAMDYLTDLQADVTIIEDNQYIRLVKKNIHLKGKKGDLVSLIPLKDNVLGVTTKNLQYPLTNEDLLFGYSRGNSNIFTQKTAEISLEKGTLLIIHTTS